MLEYSLSDTQLAFIDDAHRYALFLGGVGAGKTHAGAVKALQEFNGRPSLGMVVAPTYPMLRDATWRTAHEVWAPLIEHAARNEMRMVLRGGHEVIFRSADEPDRLRAINAAWLWVDEAAMCHPDTWPIAIGRLRQHGSAGRAWLTTTPKGMNWLYSVFVVGANDDTAIFRASTHSNPFLDEAYVESLRSQYEGDFALQELDAEFIADDEAALIHYEWIEDARLKEAGYDPSAGPLVAGVDVAGPGESETVCCVRQATDLLDVRATTEADPLGVVLDCLRGYIHHGLAQVNVDAAGIGWNFVPRLREGLPDTVEVVPVNVGESASTKALAERFVNLKAELYWTLRDRFEAGEIAGVTDAKLRSQLAGIHYRHKGPKTEIEKKDEALKRGVASPDRAEALMLAFAPPSQVQRLVKMFRSAAVRR